MSTGEQIAAVNGVELCWEGFGERSDPALLLAHGAGDSMIAWREGLCERLADDLPRTERSNTARGISPAQ